MPKKGNKQWQHPPEALVQGHILYTVKFLGECTVEQPKGTEVVKDAIRKMKFNKHIKRAEGQKPPKVELTISVDAVSILDPKSRHILHQYPLHRISYCADDKSDKRMFTFIAKEANGNKHYCYVFDSEKCAEEITLTIGQAFDLAYKRFLETSATDGDIRKQFLVLQKRVRESGEVNMRRRTVRLECSVDKDDRPRVTVLLDGEDDKKKRNVEEHVYDKAETDKENRIKKKKGKGKKRNLIFACFKGAK